MSAGGGRVLLLIIPMFLLALQLLVGLRLPRADHAGSPGAFKDGVAFTVISIEPERRSARQTGSLDFLRDETGANRGYEDENEMPIGDRERGRGFELQQWASGEPSFTAELERVIAYITTPQVNCSRVLLPGESQASQASGALWLLCVEGWSLPSQGPPCVAYSFRFDPSGQHGDRASSGYRDDGFGGFRQYRAWLDWRAARGRKQKKKGVLCSGSRTLKDIMETLGHHTVDFLYADLLSGGFCRTGQSSELWGASVTWLPRCTSSGPALRLAGQRLRWSAIGSVFYRGSRTLGFDWSIALRGREKVS
ncbi:uncharacterized protein LOC115173849 isoform X2 [Salmo trutta]|uniref:uncharacterized protein LOC115173849 isoform X2 n=1 Tax=Salmo trutta TaxID=8032 RepID=UPI00112FEB0B|nr:uncharacterized protein LOC115173849 isoform X2 [Salmo trutta]